MSDQNGNTENVVKSNVVVPQKIKNLHSKAMIALERNNTDTAISLLTMCIEQCPEFLAARRNLRLAEITMFKMKNSGKEDQAHLISNISGFLPQLKIKGLIKKGKGAEAVLEAEKLLAKDPLNPSFLKVFADAAVCANLGEAAVMTLELAKEHMSAGNLMIMELLGTLYYKIKDYKQAISYLQSVVRVKSNDSALMKMLKDSEALSTLEHGWTASENDKNWRTALANKEEAIKLEQQNKMVKTAMDADALIADAKAKLEAEPKNMNYYFALAGLFVQQKRYDEAIEVLNKAHEFAPADPELDRRTSNTIIDKYKFEIDELTKAGDTAAAEQKTAELSSFVFEDIKIRVSRYPNDYHLRFELGYQYYERAMLDDAIEQLQLAQRSPKDKVSALYYLALCFRSKSLLDMAVSQLNQAIELLPSMNEDKKNIYYLMGEICEEEGDIEGAARNFKEIYKVDSRYKDITSKIEKIYAAQKAASNAN